MRLFKFEDKKDRLVFLVGCFSSVYISLVGRVYIGELIIFFLYLFKPEVRRISFPPFMKKVRNLLWIWLASAIVSDLVRGTPMVDSIKGMISILFLILLLPFVYWALHDKFERWFDFFLGSIVSSQITYYFLTSTTEFGSTEIWKIYAYIPLITALAGLLYKAGHAKLSCFTFFLCGFWGLYNGSRNCFLICSLAFVVILYTRRFAYNSLKESFAAYKKHILGLAVLLIVGLVAVDLSYEYLAVNGHLGDEAYEKYMKQTNNDVGLASGRVESLIAASLVTKSPIFGYGSYAKDRTNYVYNYYISHNLNINIRRFDYDEDSVENMLPRHSRIFGLWMWHGMGAGLFWLFVVFLFYRVLRSGCLLMYPELLGLTIYTLFLEIWNTFFSIMGERLGPLFFWTFLLLVYDKYVSIRDYECE